MHYAARRGHVEVSDFLLKSGIAVWQTDIVSELWSSFFNACVSKFPCVAWYAYVESRAASQFPVAHAGFVCVLTFLAARADAVAPSDVGEIVASV